jgi:DNA repair photolyase
MEQKDGDYLKGRGSQLNTSNPYLKNSYVKEHPEWLDEPWILNKATQYFYESPKKVVNKVDSPDLGMGYSINPYQGCEHGCIYCYARNSHQYWGFSAGIDFESKIIVKRNAAELLEKQFQNKNWKPEVIMVSGNTDCYQPVERKLKITRSLLEVFLKYRNPVGIITKNSLILRDLDILKELAKLNLVIGTLSANGIPAGVMTAPIVPGINSDEIPAIIEAAAEKGADCAGYTIVRLNGSIGEIFSDWIHKAFPDKAEKVLNHIKECHGGQLNDSRWGTRMRGEGKIAESIRQLFSIAVKKHIKPTGFSYDYSLFRVPANGQLDLFDKEIF